jgi:hypothetical protein
VKIEPLGRTVSKPFALVEPGNGTVVIHHEGGTARAEGPVRSRKLLEKFGSHRLYVDTGLTTLRHTTGALQWSARTWRGRTTSMQLDGTKVSVSSLRGILSGSPNPFEDLGIALAWVGAYGVGPSSPSQMAWNLWRSTLDDDVAIHFDSAVGRAALFGGRQEIPRVGTYKHMASVDMVAAYPHSMGTRPYALGLETVDPATKLDPLVAGLCQARVFVPSDLPFAPLPVRIAKDMIQFQTGGIRGVWPWVEITAALEIGCKVTVERCWAPSREADLFSAWWKIIEQGRKLPGAAGRFVKMVGNCAWGIFGMVGDDQTIIAWKDDAGNTPYTVAAVNRRLPHANLAHIAAETTARVRSRLLREGLYGGGAGTPVHVDTDGIIVRKSRPLPSPAGSESGCWRNKQTMNTVEVRAPQLYRWLNPVSGEWTYVAAGSNPEQARHIFRTTPAGRLQLGWRPMLDTVLPTSNSLEPMGAYLLAYREAQEARRL